VIIPSVKVIRGEGKPRLIVVTQSIYSASAGVTFSGNICTVANGSPINISSVGVDDLVVCSGAHSLVAGDWVLVAGSDAVPDINGVQRVDYIDGTTKLNIGVDITVAGTGVGTVRKCPAFSTILSSNIFVVVWEYDGGLPLNEVHGKIASITDDNNFVVDEWRGGTPTNGSTIDLKGFVADLPRTNQLIERFTPGFLMHRLYRNRLFTKHKGFEYLCTLVYDQYVSGDTLLLLSEHFNMSETDSLILIPRIDEYGNQYNVYIANSFDLGMLGKGEGYSGFRLELPSKELVHNLDTLEGYGYGYGENYGEQL
jgi:hypothetical protein